MKNHHSRPGQASISLSLSLSMCVCVCVCVQGVLTMWGRNSGKSVVSQNVRCKSTAVRSWLITSRQTSEAEAGWLVRSHLETVFENRPNKAMRPNKAPCCCWRHLPCGLVICTRLDLRLMSLSLMYAAPHCSGAWCLLLYLSIYVCITFVCVCMCVWVSLSLSLSLTLSLSLHVF